MLRIALCCAWMSIVLGVGVEAEDRLVLENDKLAREFSIADGRLATTRIVNNLADTELVPTDCPEFRLRISKGTDKPDTDVIMTAEDFKVVDSRVYEEDGARVVSFSLVNEDPGVRVVVRYSLRPEDFYARKQLIITSKRAVALERIDIERLAIPDAYQPYTKDAITARANINWSPNIGQPLYTRETGAFWGVEFPAARNQVQDGMLSAGYLWGRKLKPGEEYATYQAVVGVTDQPSLISDAFQEYIDRIRCRPLRLQVQYNTWFDYGGGVDREKFARSVAKIHSELVEKRGNRPLSAYVIDDGWQDVGADWSDKVWKVNGKFDPNLAEAMKAVKSADSHLGLWLSPGCLFGASAEVPKLRSQGFEALDNWMSMAGPKYMQLLEDRMKELVAGGVAFFKLDGLFGHANVRNFELHGERYGIPSMPQLGLERLQSGSEELNDPKYDELKLYYLTAGTERLIEIFDKLAEINPDIYLLISNGAYLSPWWLMHVDAVWMINAGDAASGSTRTEQLVYRDGKYYKIFVLENTQHPLNAVFNHEPKKTGTGEPKEVFRKYLYMSLSRGTGFVELYIKPLALQPYDWDVLSEGLFWTYATFPCFKRTRMHGGDPREGDVYGYTGWTWNQGYVSLHNPSSQATTYTFTLDRAFGLLPDSGPFHVTSPLDGGMEGISEKAAFGDAISVTLQPREIRILNFDRGERDWSRLKALQTRTKGPEAVRKGHPIIGVWEYEYNGDPYTRNFAVDGYCTLKRGDEVQWRKPFAIVGKNQVSVQGAGMHTLQPDGSLRIEGRYTARRKKNE